MSTIRDHYNKKIVEKRILSSFTPTEHQKMVLTRVKNAQTPKLAGDEISGDEKLVTARDTLVDMGLIDYDEDTGEATVTEDGDRTMQDLYLVDELGQLTDDGMKYAYPEGEEPESGFGGELGGSLPPEETGGLGMGESLIHIVEGRMKEMLLRLWEETKDQLSEEIDYNILEKEDVDEYIYNYLYTKWDPTMSAYDAAQALLNDNKFWDMVTHYQSMKESAPSSVRKHLVFNDNGSVTPARDVLEEIRSFPKSDEGNTWSLYSNRPGWRAAHRALENRYMGLAARAKMHGVKGEQAHEFITQKMIDTMSKHREHGANDTEPHEILRHRLRQDFPLKEGLSRMRKVKVTEAVLKEYDDDDDYDVYGTVTVSFSNKLPKKVQEIIRRNIPAEGKPEIHQGKRVTTIRAHGRLNQEPIEGPVDLKFFAEELVDVMYSDMNFDYRRGGEDQGDIGPHNVKIKITGLDDHSRWAGRY